MNPAYQGQLDVFCAAYAVINAMRHINATRLLTCRAILHEALLDVSTIQTILIFYTNMKTSFFKQGFLAIGIACCMQLSAVENPV